MLKNILREPLFHFLLLGAAIFAAHSFLATDSFSKPNEIVVTQGKLENLVTTFARTWQRPPTTAELQGLIEDYVREEVAYREGVKLGLDQDDTIIRRRLRQKLEFVSDEVTSQLETSDQELETYLNSHANVYRSERNLSFRHVYLNPEKRGDQIPNHAKKILAKLQSEADPNQLGDPTMIESKFIRVTTSDVSRLFGEPFATKLASLQKGQWIGPVESGYGSHLVLVTDRQEGQLPALNEVRDRVRRDWDNEQRAQAMSKFYEALTQRYTVRVEPPQPEKLAELR